MRALKRSAPLPLLAAIVIAGCGRSRAPAVADASPSELIVSVAASTVDALDELVTAFRKVEPDVAIKLNAGPSNGLAQQILAGAPADLFLSASDEWAKELSKADRAAESAAMATNRLVIVTPRNNPAAVTRPQDLLSDKVEKLALAGEKVPAGMYADQALEELGLLDELAAAGKVVRGQDVRSALAYVERGEAEAGIVYATDVAAAKGVTIVHEFDPKLHDAIRYVLVLVKPAVGEPSDAAQAFFKFLLSGEAAETFERFGFESLIVETADRR